VNIFGTVGVEAFRADGLDLLRMTIIASTQLARNALVGIGRFLSIAYYSKLTVTTSDVLLNRLLINLPTASRPIGIVTSILRI
jgi:hypothetical protein